MLVILKSDSTSQERAHIIERVEKAGGSADLHTPRESVIVVNGCPPSLIDEIGLLPGVASVRRLRGGAVVDLAGETGGGHGRRDCWLPYRMGISTRHDGWSLRRGVSGPAVHDR